jgi:uncharacterized protein YjbJ (UPF0337 family)
VKKFALIAVASAAALGLAACDTNDRNEANTAETDYNITTDNATDDTNMAAEDAMNAADAALDNASEAVENATDAVENAADQMTTNNQ